MKHTVQSLALGVFLSLGLSATAGPPAISFDDEGAHLHGKPGARLAWLSVVHEQRGPLMGVRSPRGLAVLTAAGTARVEMKKARGARAIWLVADLEDGGAVQVTPPGYSISRIPVKVAAPMGRTAFTVTAPVARVLYLRPGSGAWAFSGVEGTSTDADGAEDAIITVSLASLQSLQGNDPPPAVTEPGDVILVIDSRWMRIGRAGVER
jgi:hypothetical protein